MSIANLFVPNEYTIYANTFNVTDFDVVSMEISGASNQLVFDNNPAQTTTINVTTPAASQVLSIPDTGFATAQFVMTEGNQQLDGTKTFEDAVVLNSGITTPNATSGYAHTGTLTDTVAGGTIVFAGKVGNVTFTGVDIAGTATVAFTITNTVAGTAGLVSMYLNNQASDSIPVIQNVTWNVGVSIVIDVENLSTATATGVSNFSFSFISFD